MPSLRRCPWSQISEETWVAYSWWRDWKDLSILPWGGTDLSTQPAYVIEAIRHCENTYNKIQNEAMEKQRTEMKSSSDKNKRTMSGHGA